MKIRIHRCIELVHISYITAQITKSKFLQTGPVENYRSARRHVLEYSQSLVSPQKKSGGYRSGECGYHSTNHFLINVSPKQSFNLEIDSCEVCIVLLKTLLITIYLNQSFVQNFLKTNQSFILFVYEDMRRHNKSFSSGHHRNHTHL